MPDEVRVLTRNETEQYIIKERFAKQYSSVDGGREARFRLAQGSMAGQLAHASDPVKNAELADALNSLAHSPANLRNTPKTVQYTPARSRYMTSTLQAALTMVRCLFRLK